MDGENAVDFTLGKSNMRFPGDRHSSSKDFEAFIRNRLRIVKAENFAKLPLASRLFQHFTKALLVALLVGYSFEIVSPVMEQNFSHDSLLQLAVIIFLFAGAFPLSRFYENTSVRQLSVARRVVANMLLCLGGLAFLVAALFLRLESYFSFIAAISVCGFVLYFARSYAKCRA